MMTWNLNKNYTWRSLALLLTFLGTILVTFWNSFLNEAVKQLVSKVFNKPPALSYELLSMAQMNKISLQSHAQQQFGQDFTLDLDDPFIQQYTVSRIRIKNEGLAIANSFQLKAIVSEGAAKIIDVKHVVKLPVSKVIPIGHSVPPLKSDFSKLKTVTFKWNSTDKALLGHYVYKSMLKDVGFGRFNNGIIKATCFTVNEQDISPGYYAIISVGVTGHISSLSKPPLRLPEQLGFSPRFKDVVWIDPDLTNDECPDKTTHVYSSVT